VGGGDAREALEYIRLTDANADALAPRISALVRASDGRDIAPATWRHLYLDNPVTGSGLVLARRGEEIVGKLGAVAVAITIDGEPTTAELYEGLVVAAEERSWDCARGLIAASWDAAESRGARLGFGFASGVSGPLADVLGHARLGPMPILTAFPSLRRALRGRGISAPLALVGAVLQPVLAPRERDVPGLKLTVCDRFDATFDELGRAFARRRRIALAKDGRYLDWRYRDFPGRRYVRLGAWRDDEPVGLAVFRGPIRRDDGFVLELLSQDDDPGILSALASEATQRLRTAGAGMVAATFPKGSPEDRALRTVGFRAWGTSSWRMEFVVNATTIDDPEGFLDRARWHLGLGDWIYH